MHLGLQASCIKKVLLLDTYMFLHFHTSNDITVSTFHAFILTSNASIRETNTYKVAKSTVQKVLGGLSHSAASWPVHQLFPLTQLSKNAIGKDSW